MSDERGTMNDERRSIKSQLVVLRSALARFAGDSKEEGRRQSTLFNR